MTESRIYTAALVIIGDEILSGRTQDKNVSQIALWLNIQGIRLRDVFVLCSARKDFVADDYKRCGIYAGICHTHAIA